MRGGGRSKPNLSDPRTAMHTRAMQKTEEQMPELPAAVANTLLRAEARTVTAVLHSKSQSQLQEGITAALRRAGYPPLAALRSYTTATTTEPETATVQTLQSSVEKLEAVCVYQQQQQQGEGATMQIMAMINSYRVAQTAVINDLAAQLKKLDARMQCWEEHYSQKSWKGYHMEHHQHQMMKTWMR